MSNSFRRAERAGVSLLIGIAGASGAGKTLSALRLARGLVDGDDSKIAVIDTEAGRALHYAPAPGVPSDPMTFDFSHASLTAPFRPARYLELIEEADKAGFGVIVIDSFSHVWEGEGGLMEWHDDIVAAAVETAEKRWNSYNNGKPFDVDAAAGRANIVAWSEPKSAHKRLISRLLQCQAHLVICLRAQEKLRMEKVTEEGRNGRSYEKTVITAASDLPPTERWSPICEKNLPYELITSLILTPDNPGVPIPIKLQKQHRDFVPLDKPLDEEVGRRLAAWARGAQPPGPRPAASPATFDLDPTSPRPLNIATNAPAETWKRGGVALRNAMRAAPEHAVEWWRLNGLAFKARSAALADEIEKALPPPDYGAEFTLAEAAE